MTALMQPARRRRRNPPTMRFTARESIDEFKREKRHCAICQIWYLVPEGTPATGCPLCIEKAHNELLSTQIKDLSDELQLTMQNQDRLAVQVNELDAMRKALTAINVEDLTFIKSFVYRWRADEASISLVATQDPEDRWEFLVRVKHEGRGRLGEQHYVSSFGGIALAASFQQEVKVSGIQNATRMLTRAVSQHLANVELGS